MAFQIALLNEVCAAVEADHRDNFDHYRFSHEPCPRQPEATFLSPYLADFERLFDTLADAESRQLLVKVLAYRILGHRRVRLPLSTPAYWDAVKSIEALAISGDYLQLSFHNWRLERFPLRSAGLPLDLYSTPMAVYTQFFVPQYAYMRGGVSVRTCPGDIVIDAGACWGDSALYFALQTGEAGRVYSFEFVPENLSVLRRNLALNSQMSARIQVVEAALADEPSALISYAANGPATRLGGSGVGTAHALSIDEFVHSERLPHVDFIKMDIEGSETLALAGSLQTLQRFRPRLAIAVYHSLRDFTKIPEWIASLGLGYRLYLGHASVHEEETVLFAESRERISA